MANPSVEESATRPPKISASFNTAVRASCAMRMRTRTSSRTTAGDSVRSVACSTFSRRFICLITCWRSAGSTSTTMVMRESSGSSVRATVRLSMLYPRWVSRPVTRISAPGLFSSSTEITCSMTSLLFGGHRNRNRLRRAQHHFVDGRAGRHHGVYRFGGRDLHVQQVRPGLADRFIERRRQLRWLLDDPSLEAVSPSQFLRVREAVQLDAAQAVIVEQGLPLAHHAQVAVVHHDDLDGQAVAGDRRQLGNRHLKTA